MTERTGLLILGLGNVLCRDDGLGPAAVARFAREWAAPEGVTVEDGGTLGLALLPAVEDARRVLLVDAVRLEAPPGTPVRLSGGEIDPAVRDRLSVHQVGVGDLMDALRLRGRVPEEIVLVGAVPASAGLGLGLTPPLEAALPGLVATIAAEAARMGFPCQRRDPQDALPDRAHALFGM